MALLRALIIEPRFLKRLYFRAMLRSAGIDSVVARDPRTALRFTSPYAIDLLVCRDRLSLAPEGDFQELVDAGLFGADVPRVTIAQRRETATAARPDLTSLSGCIWPADFFRAVDAALDAGDLAESAGEFRKT